MNDILYLVTTSNVFNLTNGAGRPPSEFEHLKYILYSIRDNNASFATYEGKQYSNNPRLQYHWMVNVLLS